MAHDGGPLPPFLTSLVTLGVRAVGFQSKKVGHKPSMENLLDNAKRIFQSKFTWSQQVAQSLSPDHEEIRSKMERASAKIEVEYSILTANCDIEHLAPEAFYKVYLAGYKALASACCTAHDVARLCYVEEVEAELKLASRSLQLCSESLKSKQRLVDKFDLATTVLARLAESCSKMAVQPTTPELLSKSLNDTFDALNNLNERLANRINDSTSAPPSKEADAQYLVMQVIKEIESLVDDIYGFMNEERLHVRRQDLFSLFISVMEDAARSGHVREEAHAGRLEGIERSGAANQLRQYTAATGSQPSDAMMKLATETDRMAVALEGIQYGMSEAAPGSAAAIGGGGLGGGNASMLKSAVSAATNNLHALSAQAAYVLANGPPASRESLLAQTQELAAVRTAIERTDPKTLRPDQQVRFVEDSHNNVRRTLQRTMSQLSARTDRPSRELRIKLGEKIVHGEEALASPVVEARQTLAEIAREAEAHLSQYAEQLKQEPPAAPAASDLVVVPVSEEDFNAAAALQDRVDKTSRELLQAANAILENGADGFGPEAAERRAQLLRAYQSVDKLVELSQTLLPAAPLDNTILSRASSTDDPILSEAEQAREFIHMDYKYEDGVPEELLRPADDSEGAVAAAAASRNGVSVGETPMMRHVRRTSGMRLNGAGADDEQAVNAVEEKVRRTHEKNKAQTAGQSIVKSAIKTIEEKLDELEEQQQSLKKLMETTAAAGAMSLDASNERAARKQFSNLAADHIWNENTQLVFVRENNRFVVRAGNLNQLVVHLTSPLDNAADALSGSDFYKTFMMTLQTFTEPEIFVKKMVERYDVPPCPDGINYVNYESDVRNPVQMRVCNVFKKWIINRYDQDLAHKPHVIDEIIAFINNVVRKDSEYLADNLQQCLSLYISGERFLYHRKLAQGIVDRPVGPSDASIIRTMLQFDPKQVAVILTQVDAEYFRAIRLYELAGQAWSKKDAKTRAPNLTKLVNHTNLVSIWVAYAILSEPRMRTRRKIMSNMILLCQFLRSLNNFHGVMGVLAGLSSAAVTRLKYTLRDLPARFRKMQADIETEMSSLGSFRTYRASLRAATGPVIPFMGVILSDLTFIEDGNPNFTPDGLINWTKRALLYNILSAFLEFQRVCQYDVPDPAHKAAIVADLEAHQSTPTLLYKMSLELEPRDALPPEMTSEKVSFLGAIKRFAMG